MIPDEDIFDVASDLPAVERPTYLDKVCAGQPEVRARVEALLRSHDVRGFMEPGVDGRGMSKPSDSSSSSSAHQTIRSTPCPVCGTSMLDRTGDSQCPRCLLEAGLSLPALDSRPGSAPKLRAAWAEGHRISREEPGTLIGRYRLIEQIGEGGFGVVWLAEQIEPVTRRVALKIIKAGMDTHEVIGRFEAERQALAMMDHQGIAKVFDAGATDTGRPFFVMEFVNGVPITKFCEERGIDTRGRLELFVEVCSAINHAHQKGVIHRDIKPSNVIVTLDGDRPLPKVIDFGIAKATREPLTDRTVHTHFDQFVGTPAYMSPEQTALSGLDVDTRSDIYSLGILLYELLTGKPPFDSKSLLSASHEEMRRVICEVEPPRPSARVASMASSRDRRTPRDTRELIDQLRGDLDWVVMKAIEKDRSRRYETANGLAMDIQRFLADDPVTATPPSAGYRFRKFARRHNAALRVAAVMAGVLITATFVSSWQAVRAWREQLEARAQTQRAERGEATAIAATEQLRRQLREAAQSDRVTAQDLAAQGRFREALVRLARACEYAPDSSEAAEQAVVLSNSAGFCLPVVALTGHEDRVTGAQFSADGRRVVTASADNTARVWNAGTGRLVAILSGQRQRITSAEFTPDGSRVATASADNSACVWDAATGRLIVELNGHQAMVRTVEFSPDGARVLTASNDRTVRLWDATKGELERVFSGHAGDVNEARFSLAGNRIVSASDDGTARVWDAATGRLVAVLSGHERDVGSARFSPDGSRVVTASDDNTARVWDASSGRLLDTLAGHQHRIRSAEFSPDGTRVLTISDDRTARVWDAATGRHRVTLEGHRERLRDGHFSADGRRIVTAGDDRTARVWDAATGHLIATLSAHRDRVWMAKFSPDGARVITASDDRTAHVWDVISNQPVAILSNHEHRVWGAQFSPDGTQVVTHSDDGTARVWESATGRPIATLAGHTGRVWSAQFSPDGTRIATASADRTARVWQAATGAPVAVLSGHDGGVSTAQFNPDGTRVVTASFDKTARVWDATSGRLIATLSGHESFVWNARFNLDGARVITASDDATARVWDATTGAPIMTLIGHESDVWGLDFSPDGGHIATASFDKTARVWDATSGVPVLTLAGHENLVRSVQFSLDGTRLATSADDNSARVWDAATGHAVVVIPGHRDYVRNAYFSPDGTRLLTVSWEQARVWDPSNGRLIATVSSGHQRSVQPSQQSLDGARIASAVAERDLGPGALAPEEIDSGVVDIFSDHRARINGAQFNSDETRIVTASDDRTARVWEWLGTRQPPPSWFPDLLSIVAAGTLNSHGELEELPVEVWLKLRAELIDSVRADSSRYGDVGRYYLTPGPDRPVRPGAALTSREAADALISPGATRLQLERAYALDPAHPLIPLALARFAETPAEAEFLRRHALDRLSADGTPALRERAAAFRAEDPRTDTN